MVFNSNMVLLSSWRDPDSIFNKYGAQIIFASFAAVILFLLIRRIIRWFKDRKFDRNNRIQAENEIKFTRSVKSILEETKKSEEIIADKEPIAVPHEVNKKEVVETSELVEEHINESKEQIVQKDELLKSENNTNEYNEVDPLPDFIDSVVDDEKVVTIVSHFNPNNKVSHIGFKPSASFEQNEPYCYPVAMMPKANSKIKFPRTGRRENFDGHTEKSFFKSIQNYFCNNLEVYNNKHIPIKNKSFPYEPDIILVNRRNGKNIYIDVEIDEPYEGCSRIPIHEKDADHYRDVFFRNRGWVVIRFAEIQVHQEPLSCCKFISEVIGSIDADYIVPNKLALAKSLDQVKQWDSLEAKRWAKTKYREQYLGISSFDCSQRKTTYQYQIDVSPLDEEIEKEVKDDIVGKRTKQNDLLAKTNSVERDSRIEFIEESHKYIVDGNPNTISVSELISKFFPEFDSKHWAPIKAKQRGITTEEILNEWELKRDEAAQLGTNLHKEIENYYNELPYNDELPGFKHFLEFKEKYSTMEKFRTEWRIFDEELMVAGTIDMVYYNSSKDSYYMFDWKRSEKVVDQFGNPLRPDFDYAFGELGHLSDNSFNKYSLQLNIYKHILEKRYGIKISSMNLLVLHPNYDTYRHVAIDDMTKEVKYIMEQAKNL